MNTYAFDDIHVGLKHSFDVELTPQMMTLFERITGDNNPLHTDIAFAQSLGYKDTVAHGMLVNSFYSRLVGLYIPGKQALFHGISASFVAPVFPGDVLNVYGEVRAVHAIHKQIEIKGVIVNQQGVKVSRAKLKAGTHG